MADLEPRKAAVRKRAPRKKAAPAAKRAPAVEVLFPIEPLLESDGTVAGAQVTAENPFSASEVEGLVESVAAPEAAAPVKKATRKRVTKSKAEQPPAELDSPPAAPDSAPISAAEPEPPASVEPSFGALLFQAPVLTAPVRRRAVATPVIAATVVEPELSAESEPLDEDPDSEDSAAGRKRRRRGGRGRRSKTGAAELAEAPPISTEPDEDEDGEDEDSTSSRRRRRRRRRSTTEAAEIIPEVVTGVRGSTRLEAKKQRRRDGREGSRRKPIVTEAEFLARRESVARTMVVRERNSRIQIGVLEDDILVEHYVANETNSSLIGNIYLGRVQNVLPSMEAAFIDIGKGRNAVLYAGEVNWDAAGMDGQPRRIELALKSGDQVLVQVTKDPMGHKGARLTSQISLPGRYLVYVPNGSMTGISRKLPDTERNRLKKILKQIVPEHAGVIVRTAAERATSEELERDIERLTELWEHIETTFKDASGGLARLIHGEPDLMVRVIRDVFNEDFAQLVVSGERASSVIGPYVASMAPDLADRITRWTASEDVFGAHRIDEQLAKAMDRKVYLPSGGSLVIDRTEAMTVVDVNTGKFIGAGGNLEETVTKNNLEAAEEIVRQLRLRDIGGIIVVDFIDMVLESNRDMVLRRLVECLGRDRTKHQVTEVTSLGLVQMTRKRVGQGLLEVFSEPCIRCDGRGVIVHDEPIGRTTTEPSYRNTRVEPAPREQSRARRPRVEPAPAPTPPPPAPPAAPIRQPIPAGLVATLAHPTETPARPPTPARGRRAASRPTAPAGPAAPATASAAPAVAAISGATVASESPAAVEISGNSAPVPATPAVLAAATSAASTGAMAPGAAAMPATATPITGRAQHHTVDAASPTGTPVPAVPVPATPAPPRRSRRASAPAGPPVGS